MDKIIVHVWNPARVVGDLFSDNFALANDGVLRAIQRDFVMHTAE